MDNQILSKIITTSDRLILRRFNLNDADFIVELLNTDGWIRNIGDRNVKTTPQARGYLENGPIRSYLINGFGLYLVELKSDGRPIGMCGLIKRDYLEHIDIGFAFLPEYTGKGYAHEIAKKTLEYAFENLNQEKIMAITLPENSPSIKLLEKLGFVYDGKVMDKNTSEELSVYATARK
jgi:[ribosomal protein S5]-alanine N-acetyltransferase